VDTQKKLTEFNKRWNITSDDSYEEEFKKFKARVLNIFAYIDKHVTTEGISEFCQILGIKEEWKHDIYGGSPNSLNIINALDREEGIKFYKLLQIISYLPISTRSSYGGKITSSRSIFFNRLAEAIKYSNVNLAMVIKEDEVILYPQGEKELDSKLVDEVLSFLDQKSQKHFVDALGFYEQGDGKNTIKSAESLRRSLEEFLRFKLGNSNGLAKNISKLQSVLKKDGRDPQIRKIMIQIFSYLDQYFNENSKHEDGEISLAENEYLIYQTGVLMRYVNSEEN